jgi:hypothetical protein
LSVSQGQLTTTLSGWDHTLGWNEEGIVVIVVVAALILGVVVSCVVVAPLVALVAARLLELHLCAYV